MSNIDKECYDCGSCNTKDEDGILKCFGCYTEFVGKSVKRGFS